MITREKSNEEFQDNYFTKNRKLKLEEYDDNGNLIDVVEFSQKDLWDFYVFKNNWGTDLRLARKSDREYFKGKQLELLKRMLYLFNDYYFDDNIVKEFENIFNTHTIEEIEFAIDFKNYYYNENQSILSADDFYKVKRMKFIDVLNWVKSSDGIYYAVENDGTKGMTYLEKPTRKQAKYQRQRNGKRIVFLSFKTWKEYEVNESEL